MKRLIAVLPMLVLASALTVGARAAYEPDVDYSQMMINAAVVGDYETGRAADAARKAKIADMGLYFNDINFDELMLLSKIMYAEAGSVWLSDQWKMCVGEVVLNRVASPEFPNTIADVLAQPGQYYGANSRYFNSLLPSETCVRLALRLLEGERVMNDPAVVFQANFRQGSGTHTAIYDRYLGWTYFCYSSKPELYAHTAAMAEAPADDEDFVAEETPEMPEVETPAVSNSPTVGETLPETGTEVAPETVIDPETALIPAA